MDAPSLRPARGARRTRRSARREGSTLGDERPQRPAPGGIAPGKKTARETTAGPHVHFSPIKNVGHRGHPPARFEVDKLSEKADTFDMGMALTHARLRALLPLINRRYPSWRTDPRPLLRAVLLFQARRDAIELAARQQRAADRLRRLFALDTRAPADIARDLLQDLPADACRAIVAPANAACPASIPLSADELAVVRMLAGAGRPMLIVDIAIATLISERSLKSRSGLLQRLSDRGLVERVSARKGYRITDAGLATIG